MGPMTTGSKKTPTRYALATEARYRLTRNGAALVAGRGRTVEMNTTGILLELDHTLPAAARIDLTLDWPGLYHNAGSARLRISGQVLRVDGRSVEVRILSHYFETFGVASLRRTPSGRLAVA
jgi:hypothetical protein